MTPQPRPSPEELEDFFGLSLDLLCIAGNDGYFKKLNAAWSTTLGWSLEELLSRPYVEFVHPDDVEKTIEAGQGLAEGEDVVSFENRYLCKDGTYRDIRWTASASAQTDMVYAVARDITEAKAVEDELRRSKEEAEAANLAKSAFLATMSHELRTPLNSVIGFANVLAKNPAEHFDPQELEYLERIRSNGLHLLGLINTILDLSKIEAGRSELSIEEVDLVELVHATLDQLPEVPADRDLVLIRELPDAPVPMRTDPARMRQVLLNLVGNGLKFTEAGRVRVRLEVDARGRATSLAVSDTGPGIPAEQLDLIFEPFRQLDDSASRRHGGSGLGLAITRSLVDALGMRLEVESTVGEGSTFTLRMPR